MNTSYDISRKICLQNKENKTNRAAHLVKEKVDTQDGMMLHQGTMNKIRQGLTGSPRVNNDDKSNFI